MAIISPSCSMEKDLARKLTPASRMPLWITALRVKPVVKVTFRPGRRRKDRFGDTRKLSNPFKLDTVKKAVQKAFLNRL